MDQYDNLTIDVLATERYIETKIQNSRSIGNLYKPDAVGTLAEFPGAISLPDDEPSALVFKLLSPAAAQVLKTLDKDGEPADVSQGFGLGIRQHDDVMLSFDYSFFTRHETTITGGDFLIMTLDTNDINQHHTEERVFSTRTESVQFKVYDVTDRPDLVAALTGKTAMPIIKQKNPAIAVVGTDVKGDFNYYDIQATDPFAGQANVVLIDDVPLWIASQNPANTRPDQFPAAKGRHYEPNHVYAVVAENLNGQSTEVYYQYDWHEY